MMELSRLEEAWTRDLEEILAADLDWGRLSGKRAVVTGVNGFLGGYLARSLLSLNLSGRLSAPMKVLLLTRDRAETRRLYRRWIDEDFLEVIEWDLSWIAVPDLAEPDLVLHAASLASPVHYDPNPVGTMLPNSVGTIALLEAMRSSRTPMGLLYLSSSEIYGTLDGLDSFSEDDQGTADPTNLRACYSESKRMGETACTAYSHQYGIPTFIVRPFHTYGPGLRPDDGRVFSDFAFNAVRGENIKVKSAGGAVRAFCYATDAVRGFFSVLLKGEVARPYNVANSRAALSVLELAELIASLYPEKALSVELQGASENPRYLASSKTQILPETRRLEALGWSATITPEIGFRRMIEASS